MTMNRKLGRRWLVAASLAVTLAAFGCTSNQYAGNGRPMMMTPTYNHATTPGSSSGNGGVPPMASSFTYLTPRLDVDGLANLAAMQGYRGRVLGPSGAQGYLPGVTVTGATLISPAMYVNPQATVNTSISSQPVPVITGGGVGAGINIVSTGSTATNTATTAAATTAAMTGATTSAATGALTTASGGGTTLAGSAVFSPALMNSTPAPQATGSTGSTRTSGTTITKSSSGARTSAVMMATNSSSVSSGIRIESGSNGSVTVTNVSNSTAHH